MYDIGISNVYIEKIVNPFSNCYKGTYSSNNLPNNLKSSNHFSIIVNLSSYNEPGTHWVAIYRKDSYLVYFDSLGLPPIVRDVELFLRNINPNYETNVFEYQCFSSAMCGFYVILFVLLMEKGFSFHKFRNLFTNNCKRNDKRVVLLLKHVICRMV